MLSLLLGWTGDAPSRPVGFTPHAAQDGAPKAEPIFAGSEGHIITMGSTGTGKGRSALIPALLWYKGPIFVVDPKGEACAVTSRHRAGLGPVYRLDPWRLSTDRPDTLNALDLRQHTSMSVVAAALLLANLFCPPSYSKDPFWDNRSVSIISAIFAYILNCEAPDRCNPVSARELLYSDDVAYSLAVLLDTKKEEMGAFAYQEFAQFLNLPERETRPSVLASATQHLTILGDPAVADSLRSTSLDLAAVQRGDPLTIYLIIPPEKLRSHGRLLRLWVATLLRMMITRRQRPDVPTLFLLDEAAQLGHLEDLVAAMTLLRGYGVRVWSFWQDLQQLRACYPEDWETLVTNAQTLQIFGSHWLFAERLAKLLGVHPDVLKLSNENQLLIHADGTRMTARKLDYLVDPVFRGRYDPNPMFGEEKGERYRT